MIDVKIYFDNIDYWYENKSTDNDFIYGIINTIKKIEENEEIKNVFIKELKEKYYIAEETKHYNNIIKYALVIFLLMNAMSNFKREHPQYNLYNKKMNIEIINSIKMAFYKYIEYLIYKKDSEEFFNNFDEIATILNIIFYMHQIWELSELYQISKSLMENKEKECVAFEYTILSFFNKYNIKKETDNYNELKKIFINSIDNDFIDLYSNLEEIEKDINLCPNDFTEIYYIYKKYLEEKTNQFNLSLHLFINKILEKSSLSKDDKNKERMFLTNIFKERKEKHFINNNFTEIKSMYKRPIVLQNEINNLRKVLNNKEFEISKKILYLIEIINNTYEIISNIIEKDKQSNPLTYTIFQPQIICSNLNKIYNNLSEEEVIKANLFSQEITNITYFNKNELKNILIDDRILNCFNIATQKHKKLIKNLLLLYTEDNFTVFIPMMILFVEHLNTYFSEENLQDSTATIFLYNTFIGKDFENLRDKMAHGELSVKTINGDYADVLLILFLLYATN